MSGGQNPDDQLGDDVCGVTYIARQKELGMPIRIASQEHPGGLQRR
jgi:hypothetical protein